MTLLVSWIGIDPHGPSSIYIAADSRLSWGQTAHYDHGRKVFACRNSPDIFGYCGDVLFPSMVLAQIIEMADIGLLFDADASASTRSELITRKLTAQFEAYPKDVSGINANSLEILHAARDLKGGGFACNLLTWGRTSGWTSTPMELPDHSDVLFARGAGARAFTRQFEKYSQGLNARTSRSVFQCFCDSLIHSTVASVGGAPQLAGLIRKPGSHGLNFGVVVSGRRYFLGFHIDELSNFERIEWRNELFEICDGKSGQRKPEAQPQPNPHLD